MRFMRKYQTPMKMRMGSTHDRRSRKKVGSTSLEGYLVLVEHLRELGVHADTLEVHQLTRLILHLALYLVFADGDLGDLSVLEEVEELAVRDGLHHEHVRNVVLHKENHPDADEHVPDGKLVVLFQKSSSEPASMSLYPLYSDPAWKFKDIPVINGHNPCL